MFACVSAPPSAALPAYDHLDEMKSNIEWKKWGEHDPLYAVSTWKGKDRHGTDPWTDAEFYDLGRSDWDDFQKHWEQYGVNHDCCVEVGCGAGRITKQLSSTFARVKALDVSDHQLAYAKHRMSASNVDFILTNGSRIPLPDASCTAAFSTHVFQHLDCVHEALGLFKELHRVLAVEGTLMVHLPVFELPDLPLAPLFRSAIVVYKKLGDVRAAFDRKRLLRGKWTFVMRRLRFERPQLALELKRIGFAKIEFRNFPVQSNGDYHPFVLATKPAM